MSEGLGNPITFPRESPKAPELPEAPPVPSDTPPATPSPAKSVFEEKVSVIGAFKNGFKILFKNPLIFVIAVIPTIVQLLLSYTIAGGIDLFLQSIPSILMDGLFDMASLFSTLITALGAIIVSSIIMGVVNMLVYSLVTAGFMISTRTVILAKKLSLGEVFKASFKKIGKIILGLSLSGLIIGLGFILILPGLVLILLLAYALPVFVFEDKGVVDSIKYAMSVGKKNVGKTIVFGIIAAVISSPFAFKGTVSIGPIETNLSLIPSPFGEIINTLIIQPVLIISLGVLYLRGVKKEELKPKPSKEPETTLPKPEAVNQPPELS